MFSSSSTSAVISIPDTMENNNTQIWCAAFLFGGIEFSDPPVRVTIIGEIKLDIIIDECIILASYPHSGPPLSPDPVIVITSTSSRLGI